MSNSESNTDPTSNFSVFGALSFAIQIIGYGVSYFIGSHAYEWDDIGKTAFWAFGSFTVSLLFIFVSIARNERPRIFIYMSTIMLMAATIFIISKMA